MCYSQRCEVAGDSCRHRCGRFFLERDNQANATQAFTALEMCQFVVSLPYPVDKLRPGGQ